MEAAEAEIIEDFFGVYLLCCLNPKFKGRTYIGYTVDPNRRIKQHNKGKDFGGAWKTSNKGPWTMVMIIHGFPNDISALRFEWAWQHPQTSRRLRHVQKKKYKESSFDYCFRVLSEMLRIGPWCRLPLTVRWLNEEFRKDFQVDRIPPLHIPICSGPVISKKIPKNISQPLGNHVDQLDKCDVCFKVIDGQRLNCLNSQCNLNCHLICLAGYFLEPGEYLPIKGECPKCEMSLLWGDLIRKLKGCYKNVDVEIDVTMANEFYCSDSE